MSALKVYDNINVSLSLSLIFFYNLSIQSAFTKKNTIPRLGVVGLMTIYWLSKFYSKERRILFRMDETLHHVDVPHPIHFLTHPNCLLFFICVCVYVSVFPGVRNHTIHIHKYLCTHAQTHSMYVKGGRIWWSPPISALVPSHHTRTEPRPTLLPSAHPLTYTIYIYI